MASGYQVNEIGADVLPIYKQTTETMTTVTGLEPDSDYYLEVFYDQSPPVGTGAETVFGTHTPPFYTKAKQLA
jgi:hypothetical protein